MDTTDPADNGGPRADVDSRARVGDAVERGPRDRLRGSARPALVELVFHEMHSAWALEIIRGVERVATAERAAVVLSELDGARQLRRRWFDDLLKRRPVGVILVLSELAVEQRRRLSSAGIPFVVVDTVGERLPGIPTVGSANAAGGWTATHHLITLGHRRIAMISGPANLLCSRERVDGFRRAMADANLPVTPAFVSYGDFRAGGGYRHSRRLLARPDRPTAIFAGSDFQALGVLRAAHELGIAIPDDLSVVGYDDLPLTEWTGPRLTTIRQPLVEMATTAAQMVFTLARGERPPNDRVELPTDLVVRQSTAPPRSPAGG